MKSDVKSQTSVTIRAATPNDAVLLGRIYADCFPFLFRFAYGVGPDVAGRILGDFYAAQVIPIINVYLALREETIVGFAVLRLGEAMPRPGAGEYWSVLRRHMGFMRAIRAFAGSFIVSLVFSGRAPDPKMAYLDTLGVAESRRGEGIGTALLMHCFELARQRDCAEIALHVMQSNVDAKRLYERMGFVARPDERRLPRLLSPVAPASRAWLMVKNLC